MKTQVPDHIQRSRQLHHAALESLRAPGNLTPGLVLWRKLRRIEQWITSDTTAYCNGGHTQEWLDARCRRALCSVGMVFGGLPKGLFVNRDPRGYALKLDPEQGAVIPAGLHTDLGQYGILAPEIN